MNMTFNTPGQYFQDVKSGGAVAPSISSSVGCLIGATPSGETGVATLVTSFTDFNNKFANGLSTSFIANSDLPHAVNGFFTNGGQQLYVVSVKSATAKKATKEASTNGISATAKYAGKWGNDIKIKLSKSAEYVEVTNKVFDVKVSIGTSDSATITEVTKDTIEEAVMKNAKVKNWLEKFTYKTSNNELAEEEAVLAGGADGIDDLKDADFTNALDAVLSVIDEVTLIGIPGQTSVTVINALRDFADNNRLFPIFDGEQGATVSEIKTLRKSLAGNAGVLAYPWGKVNDPLTNTIKSIPVAGHLMGVYARIIEERGVWKDPAGTEALVRGLVDLETKVNNTELGNLNVAGIVPIIAKTGYGIVVWGCRSISSDSTMRYVSDSLFNYELKRVLKAVTEEKIFEPNTETLRSNVTSICKGILESYRQKGGLKGSAEEAYYVVCDGTNNTEESINNGELNISIGYAKVKPSEFIVFKIAHSIND